MTTYKKLRMIADSHNEKNDCGVIALAAACRVSYEEAHAALSKFGRKSQDGTNMYQLHSAALSLGFKIVTEDISEFIQSRYPKGHQVLKSITTHHAARFPGAFQEGEAFLLLVRGGRHIAAVVDGVTVDWTEGTSAKTNTHSGFYRVVSNV